MQEVATEQTTSWSVPENSVCFSFVHVLFDLGLGFGSGILDLGICRVNGL